MNQPMAIVLAAGRGTRMKSDLPKVLFPALGRPMVHWVLDAAQAAGIQNCLVVVGYRGDDVREHLSERTGISYAVQEQQLGTGHAVEMCRSQLTAHNGPVLIVAGDSPMIQADTISTLLSEFQAGQYACLLGTLLKEDPTGLGRIVRGTDGRFERIVEQKDASATEQQIKEVNMSTYMFDCQALLWALSKLENANAQAEFYLTDCPEILRRDGRKVDAVPVLKPCESLSINTLDELALVEDKMREMGYPETGR
ncbi:MAG: NTP transferase domain-containing protein [Planctomycetales bacterium]|nr:NTP transferase domain-containing protein [Planctomycetales bacterium]MCB0187005.1 NTP transferase domain-containing protein [Caldilineaceae bacterium]